MIKHRTTRQSGLTTSRRGMTLLELVVVMGIIILIASIALPSIANMFSSSADVQANSTLSSQLVAARAGAVLEGTYWAVHIQMGKDDGDNTKISAFERTCYSAVMKLKRDTGKFTSAGFFLQDGSKTGDLAWESHEWSGGIVEITSGKATGRWSFVTDSYPDSLRIDGWQGSGTETPDETSAYRVYRFNLADGYAPEAMPANMAFGKITDTYVADLGPIGMYQALDSDDTLRAFTSLTIVFSPRGQLVTKVYNRELPLGRPSTTEPLFDKNNPDTQVWDAFENAHVEEGVRAVTLFNYSVVKALGDNGDARADYLNENGQFLPINQYTGQLYLKK